MSSKNYNSFPEAPEVAARQGRLLLFAATDADQILVNEVEHTAERRRRVMKRNKYIFHTPAHRTRDRASTASTAAESPPRRRAPHRRRDADDGLSRAVALTLTLDAPFGARSTRVRAYTAIGRARRRILRPPSNVPGRSSARPTSSVVLRDRANGRRRRGTQSPRRCDGRFPERARALVVDPGRIRPRATRMTSTL